MRTKVLAWLTVLSMTLIMFSCTSQNSAKEQSEEPADNALTSTTTSAQPETVPTTLRPDTPADNTPLKPSGYISVLSEPSLFRVVDRELAESVYSDFIPTRPGNERAVISIKQDREGADFLELALEGENGSQINSWESETFPARGGISFAGAAALKIIPDSAPLIYVQILADCGSGCGDIFSHMFKVEGTSLREVWRVPLGMVDYTVPEESRAGTLSYSTLAAEIDYPDRISSYKWDKLAGEFIHTVTLLKTDLSSQASQAEPDFATLEATLIIAVELDDLAQTEELLAKGADPNAKKDIQIEKASHPSALMLAAENGNFEIAETLINAGAEVNYAILVDAPYVNYYELMDSYRESALINAFKFQDITELLLENGADPDKQMDSSEQTLLMLAAEEGDIEKIQLYIRYDADVNAVRVTGDLDANRNPFPIYDIYDTALSIAVSLGDAPAVEILLDNGADIEIPVGVSGQSTVIEIAKEAGHEEIVSLLEGN